MPWPSKWVCAVVYPSSRPLYRGAERSSTAAVRNAPSSGVSMGVILLLDLLHLQVSPRRVARRRPPLADQPAGTGCSRRRPATGGDPAGPHPGSRTCPTPYAASPGCSRSAATSRRQSRFSQVRRAFFDHDASGQSIPAGPRQLGHHAFCQVPSIRAISPAPPPRPPPAIPRAAGPVPRAPPPSTPSGPRTSGGSARSPQPRKGARGHRHNRTGA